MFSKGGVTVLQNSPSASSPEDEAQRKILLSPNQVNVMPLQVELLERDIAELRTNLSEAKTRNVYLQNVVDDQKKKLSALENEKLDMAAVGKKIGKENITKNRPVGREESVEELNEKLEDADRLIRRLRRENEEQRKEVSNGVNVMLPNGIQEKLSFCSKFVCAMLKLLVRIDAN